MHMGALYLTTCPSDLRRRMTAIYKFLILSSGLCMEVEIDGKTYYICREEDVAKANGAMVREFWKSRGGREHAVNVRAKTEPSTVIIRHDHPRFGSKKELDTVAEKETVDQAANKRKREGEASDGDDHVPKRQRDGPADVVDGGMDIDG